MTRDDVVREMFTAFVNYRSKHYAQDTMFPAMEAALARAEECDHGLRPRRLTEEMRKAAMAESVKLSLMLAPREYDALWQAMYDAGGKP